LCLSLCSRGASPGLWLYSSGATKFSSNGSVADAYVCR
jgi:hypothetical protein